MATKRAKNAEEIEKVELLEGRIADLLEINASRQAEISEITEGMRELNTTLGRQYGPNWLLLYGGANEYVADGLFLDTIQSVSDDLRAHIVAGGLMKRLAEIRGDYIYGEGIKVKNIPVAFRKDVVEDPKWQETILSVKGLKELNAAHCTDGNLFVLVNTKTKKPVRIPIYQITAHYANPDDAEDIWAVRREWTDRDPSDTNSVATERWYKTDMAPANFKKRVLSSKTNGRNAPVDQDSIMVIDRVNGQVGWTWGIPDLLASLQWAEKYGAYLKAQARFADALSAIAVQYKSSSANGQKQIDSVVRNPGVAGNAVTGTEVEMIAQKGGSAVDFNNGRPMASQAAAAAGVSVVTALSDPGASGSSYGAASALDSPTTRMVISRRASFEIFLKRIFRVLGQSKATIVWPQLSDDPIYRQVSAILGAMGSGMYFPDEIRGKIAEMLNIDLTHSNVPDGYLLPNNSNSWERADIDPSVNPNTPASDQKPDGSNSLANGQGRNSLGVGNLLGDDNGLRDNERGIGD